MSTGGVIASANRQIPSLNGLRAISIGLVIWAHGQFPGHVRGAMGVTVFFFLSGYLITTLMRMEADKRGRIALGDFYVRRALRILPPMYIAIGVAVLLSIAGLLYVPMSAGGLLSSGFFFSNYWTIFSGGGIPNGLGVLWSLAVEEHFYLIFPVVYIALRRWVPRRSVQVAILIGVCLLVLAWRCWLLFVNGELAPRLYYGSDTRIDALLWGAIMAIGFNPVYGEVRLPKRRWLAGLVALGAAVVFVVAGQAPMRFNMTFGYTLQSISLFFVFAYVILAPKSLFGRFLNWRPVAFIGVLSYSLYLFHRPIMLAVENVVPIPHIAQVLLSVVISLVLSYLVYRLVDKPMAMLRKRLSHVGDGGRAKRDDAAVAVAVAEPVREPSPVLGTVPGKSAL